MLKVTDSLSNAQDQIARAATILGRSRDKTAVFKAICHGKKRVKTVEDVMDATRMSRKRVLEDAAKLANQHLIVKRREDGDVVYERNSFLAANKGRILSLALDRKKLSKYPTKTNPNGPGAAITLRLPRNRVRARAITVDDIDSFSAVAGTPTTRGKLTGISEKAFKEGVQRILGEPGVFTDWGGEKNDLLSTRLRYKGMRRRVAFAFKGPGTTGPLTPAKLGKNGDQIQRLFQSAADFYLVQYWAQIAESVPEQMQQFATAKSFTEDREIFFGVIDGGESARLVNAFPGQFQLPGRKRTGKHGGRKAGSRGRRGT